MAGHGSAPERGPPGALPNLVVIGTSAGGLSALTRVLAPLPGDLPAAIAVVQHLSPTFKSQLTEILSKSTRLRVEEARTGMRIRAAHVYVAPPDFHLMVDRNGRLRLDASQPVNFSRPAIDVLFRTAAAVFGQRVLAILLTGLGKDGSEGARAVRMHGGQVIVQDEATAEHFAMPNSAIRAGTVDYVLPLPAIAEQIMKIIAPQ